MLKKGGRMMILEFSHVQNPVLGQVYDQFSFHVIPKMGQVIANDAPSYQYLVESIRRFPKQVCCIAMLQYLHYVKYCVLTRSAVVFIVVFSTQECAGIWTDFLMLRL